MKTSTKLLLTSSFLLLSACQTVVTSECGWYTPYKMSCDKDQLNRINVAITGMTPDQRFAQGFDPSSTTPVSCASVISRDSKLLLKDNNDMYQMKCVDKEKAL